MNAVERLWRALEAGDWHAAAAQMHERAFIRMPGNGEHFSRDDYVMHHRSARPDREVDVREVVAEAKHVAVLVRITSAGKTAHGAGFYELHDGRIAGGVEIWASTDD